LDFWSVIHGDLCFSNLIYDRRRNKLNLLDPRGSFGDDGIFGDPIYDLAKLSHSINGDYDYFTSDLFYLSRNDSSIELFSGSPKRNMISREIARDFLENSIKKYSITIDELRLIEASLFLSAAHLHPEGNRGLALFTNGILIVNDVL
jgi:thiamine kinase-like enzyme